MKQKIQSIQNLRGLAALVVLIHHVFLDTKVYKSNSFILDNFYNLEYFGNIGVDVFFVISGFIMVLIHGNDFLKPYSVRTFLLKRIIRVVPLYWILTTVATLLLLFFPELFGGGKVFELSHAIASFFFIPWNNSAGMPIPILAPGWTLNFEMYFYLIFAIFLFLPKRVFISGISFYFFISVSLHILEPTSPYLNMITNPILLEFLFGVYIGMLYRREKLIEKYHFILALSIVLFLSNLFISNDITLRVVYFGIPSALLIYSLISYEYYNTYPLCRNYFVFLGNISYSLYISHVFVYKFVIKMYLILFGVHSIDFMIIIAIIASIFVAIIIYYFIEKPITYYLTERYIKKTLL